MQYPGWLQPYLERSDLMRRIKMMLDQGQSDEEIARSFQSSTEIVHRFRARWRMIRSGECPDCGNQDYNPEKDCPNHCCISNWIIPVPERKR